MARPPPRKEQPWPAGRADDEVEFTKVQDPGDLLELGNLGCIELHPWYVPRDDAEE